MSPNSQPGDAARSRPRSDSESDSAASAPEQGADLVSRHGRLVRRTALISGLTLISRVLGYAREILAAALFGDQSGIYDAFITAWRVPNLFRRFLGEGALSTSFQTVMTDVEGTRGNAAGRQLFWQTAKVLTLLLFGLAAVVMGLVLIAPDTMPLTGWAWLGSDPGPVRELTVRLMPFVVVICLAALCGGALHVRGHFAAPAWAPAVLNVVWIATLLLLGVRYGWPPSGAESDPAVHLAMARTLGVGVLVAGVLQLLVHLPALTAVGLLGGRQAGTPEGPTAAPVDRRRSRQDVLRILRRTAPLALGAAVYQINVMVDGLMAEGLLADGGPTLHYYANRVQQLPLALIAIAATSAVFPALQAHGQRGDLGAVRRLHDTTQRAICFLALPAMAGLFALARPIIAVSFERGAFGASGVERTSLALAALAFAILPAGATGLLARTYYALGDFRRPVIVSSVMLAANIGLNVLFILGAGMDVEGLALATVVSSSGTALWLALGLHSHLGLPAADRGFYGVTARMAVAAVLCGASAYGVHALLRSRFEVLGAGLTLGAAIAAGIFVYACAARALGIPEAEAAWSRVRRRAR